MKQDEFDKECLAMYARHEKEREGVIDEDELAAINIRHMIESSEFYKRESVFRMQQLTDDIFSKKRERKLRL